MKKYFLSMSLALITIGLNAHNYIRIETAKSVMVLDAEKGKNLKFLYYGDKLKTDELLHSGLVKEREAFPTFGNNCPQSHALEVKHSDGNLSLELIVDNITEVMNTSQSRHTIIVLKDKFYPFQVKLHYLTYADTDVIEMWNEIIHTEKNPVELKKFASAFFPLSAGTHYLTHLHGTWGNEQNEITEQITRGSKIIKNRDGVRNTQTDNPSFMLALNAMASETEGQVIGGSLVWTGPYKMEFDYNSNNVATVKDSEPVLEVSIGMNNESSEYFLASKQRFETPRLALSFSSNGKGQVSRNLHRWARKYKIKGGAQYKDILINSWEGVYFDVNQNKMIAMMRDFKAIGGELFVMDDGWFGTKYPRNNDHTSLGDWDVNTRKLPEGIAGLIKASKEEGIKFGIWIEPEMTNFKASEFYQEHPDWVICQKNRQPVVARGGSQVVLDLSNPEVQEFVFNVVDNLVSKFPEIAFIKWDANMPMMNYGSNYLAMDKQSHLYIDYHLGFKNIMQRINAKYPKLVLQACASGGGRVNYGYLEHFDEFWTSDDTDALQRIKIQWGTLNFYPAMCMASHVSTVPNHLTQRVMPIKFRFDVAMMGRLGMEMLPGDMNEAELDYAKRTIAEYKKWRPIIQGGDLYKLISPYDDSEYAALMFVSEVKDKAVLFAYRTNFTPLCASKHIIFQGLDSSKNYLVKEASLFKEGQSLLPQHNRVFSGKMLMTTGIQLPLDEEYDSVVLELFMQ